MMFLMDMEFTNLLRVMSTKDTTKTTLCMVKGNTHMLTAGSTKENSKMESSMDQVSFMLFESCWSTFHVLL